MGTFKVIKGGEVINIISLDNIDDAAFLEEGCTLQEVVEPSSGPVEEVARVWNQDNVRSALTLAEKTKWDNDSAPEVVTAKIEIGGGLELAAITDVLDFLVEANVISADSKTAVLA